MSTVRPFRRGGFSYIELIGILALTAILVAAVAPRLLEAISDAKINRAVAVLKSLQTATAKYSADLGTLYPLSPAGVATPSPDGTPTEKGYGGSLPDALTLPKSGYPAITEAGLWRKFQGPYARAFPGTPPLGTTMTLSAVPSAPGTPTPGNATFTLTNNPNAGIAAGSPLVFARFEDVDRREFEKLDSILDPGIGATVEKKHHLGKVKWDPKTSALLVYIAHR